MSFTKFQARFRLSMLVALIDLEKYAYPNASADVLMPKITILSRKEKRV